MKNSCHRNNSIFMFIGILYHCLSSFLTIPCQAVSLVEKGKEDRPATNLRRRRHEQEQEQEQEQVQEQEKDDVFVQEYYFRLNYTFFPGKGRQAYYPEVQSLFDVTSQFYTDAIHNTSTASPSLDSIAFNVSDAVMAYNIPKETFVITGRMNLFVIRDRNADHKNPYKNIYLQDYYYYGLFITEVVDHLDLNLYFTDYLHPLLQPQGANVFLGTQYFHIDFHPLTPFENPLLLQTTTTATTAPDTRPNRGFSDTSHTLTSLTTATTTTTTTTTTISLQPQQAFERNLYFHSIYTFPFTNEERTLTGEDLSGLTTTLNAFFYDSLNALYTTNNNSRGNNRYLRYTNGSAERRISSAEFQIQQAICYDDQIRLMGTFQITYNNNNSYNSNNPKRYNDNGDNDDSHGTIPSDTILFRDLGDPNKIDLSSFVVDYVFLMLSPDNVFHELSSVTFQFRTTVPYTT